MNVNRMKKRILLLLLVIPALLKAQDVMTGTRQELTSPDGAYRFTFYQRAVGEDNAQMYYTLTYKNRPVIEESKLGVLIENQLFESALGVPNDTCHFWCENLKLTGTERRKADETWKPVYGERAEIRDCYNEMTLKFKKGEGDGAQEGIRGNEEMPDATHNTVLPYTRFLAGAADYTLCYFNGRVKNTKAHQLAMAAVYYSPLQFMFWYDRPEFYKGEEELEFWKAIPSVWDDSRALDGEIGEYIVQARRSGNDWFVGAMTNTEARTVTLTTDFLEPGKKYMLHLYEDDDKLDTRTKVRSTHKKIKAGDKLTLKLKASGGAALHFIPLK